MQKILITWSVVYHIIPAETFTRALHKFQHGCRITNRTLKNKIIRKMSLKCYEVMVDSVLMYGSKIWAINRADRRLTEGVEMKLLLVSGHVSYDRENTNMIRIKLGIFNL